MELHGWTSVWAGCRALDVHAPITGGGDFPATIAWPFHGPISQFPLTVTVEHARVLNDVELDVLTGDLDAYVDDLDIELTRDGITVCAAVSGTQVCEELGLGRHRS